MTDKPDLLLLLVLNAIQDDMESIEILVGMIQRHGAFEEHQIRATVEQLQVRGFAIAEIYSNDHSAYVPLEDISGFAAPDIWISPTEAGTKWLRSNAPPDWYAHLNK